MKHARLFTVIAITGAAAASLTGAAPAMATARPSSLPATRAVPAAHAVRAPASRPASLRSAGLRPASPPPAGTRLPARLRAAAPADAVSCYDQQSIESAQNLDWVSAELGYTGANYAMLRARATAIGPWEKFTLFCHLLPFGPQFAYLVIQSQANASYVSAELGYTGGSYAMLRARATAISNTELYVNSAVCPQ